ncbi:BTB/POZ domain-containing protein KCTD16a [Osmerus mordax]|uniref:BTB/POZ domain-containing protein KCTD16a n=1 Tax=Osmerus mordax TaxID=8014 RepID=UPI0035106BA6
MALSENGRTQPAKEQGSIQSDVVELNVGGQVYYTRFGTLTSIPNSLLGKLFSNKKGSSNDIVRDLRGRYFIDRDGFLFRYVLDYLRDKQVVLPDHFPERGRLRREAEYFQLPELVKFLTSDKSKHCPDDYSDFDDNSDQIFSPYALDRRYGYITVGFKGHCREIQTDSKAKKVPRIFISGRVGLAKEVFGDTLNQGHDVDRPPDRYSSRSYLRFRHMERAFDMLSDNGFHIVACCSSLTSSSLSHYTDEKVWSNCTQYVFYRGPSRWSSSHCDCCSRGRERESGTSVNELSTSCSETQSEASSPQGTVICRPPVSAHMLDRTGPAHTLDRTGPAHVAAQVELMRHQTDLLRVRTMGLRQREPAKRKGGDKLTPEQAMEKCIQDFHRIRIPEHFPERKHMWQSELLMKYRL